MPLKLHLDELPFVTLLQLSENSLSSSALPCPRTRVFFTTFIIDGNLLSSIASFRSSTRMNFCGSSNSTFQSSVMVSNWKILHSQATLSRSTLTCSFLASTVIAFKGKSSERVSYCFSQWRCVSTRCCAAAVRNDLAPSTNFFCLTKEIHNSSASLLSNIQFFVWQLVFQDLEADVWESLGSFVCKKFFPDDLYMRVVNWL